MNNGATEDVLTVEGASPAKRKPLLAGQLAGGNVDAAAYADDSVDEAVQGDSLAALQALAQELIAESRSVMLAARDLRDAQNRLADVAEHRLPDLMEKHNLPKFEFLDRTTGLTLVIKLESDKWRVSMPPQKDDQGNALPENAEKRKEIYDWLRTIGQAGSIKKLVEVQAGLISDEAAQALMDEITASHPTLDVGLTEKVEPATLTALVTRLLKAGKQVHEAIQVKPVRQAKVAKK